jgi:hypothetical protein
VNRLSKSWSARSDARPETSSTDPPGETSKAETSASTQRSGRLLRRLQDASTDPQSSARGRGALVESVAGAVT